MIMIVWCTKMFNDRIRVNVKFPRKEEIKFYANLRLIKSMKSQDKVN